MTAPNLLALSLVLSIAAAALGLAVMRAIERPVADPVLRERGWAAALYTPLLPPAAVALMLLAPAPVETAPPPSAAGTTTVMMEIGNAVAPATADLLQMGSLAALGLAGALAALGLTVLAFRLHRLRRLVRAASPATEALRRTVARLAGEAAVRTPEIRVCSTSDEALLTGLHRPVLVLPAALAGSPEDPALFAVCAHELAHLKRGDHRTLWAEELLLALGTFNPLLRTLRAHRAAAREEACDALALAGAGDAERRLYARALLEAVRSPRVGGAAPALAFTSARRTFVMNRLKAVLAPASPASARSRRAVVGLSALVAGLACAGSIAVAAQRQPVIVETPGGAPTAAPAPTPTPALSPTVIATAPISQPEPRPAAAPAPAPEAPAAPDEAQEPTGPADITRVTWARQPTPMYPATAAANGVNSGTVSLSCIIGADGSASGCTVISETPEGQGFGEAALASLERARFSETLMETATPGARARFTIRFRLAE